MYAFIKRLFDVAASFAGILLLLPVFFIVFAWVKLDSEGPAVFKQVRVGRGHRLFVLYKFRTMQTGSGGGEYLREPWQLFAQPENDPRLTRAGAFLRKTSLDELPQLFNVLKGDMSLVGPRPFVLAESNLLPAMALKRLDVRPGITGLAQASGRSDCPPEKRLARDIYYANHPSLLLDARILAATLIQAVSGRGAR